MKLDSESSSEWWARLIGKDITQEEEEEEENEDEKRKSNSKELQVIQQTKQLINKQIMTMPWKTRGECLHFLFASWCKCTNVHSLHVCVDGNK